MRIKTGKDNFSQEQTKKSHSIHLLEFRGGDDMLIMLIQESLYNYSLHRLLLLQAYYNTMVCKTF